MKIAVETCSLMITKWAIHADESDPELTQQDYENYPRDWYSEWFMSEKEFKNILKYSELCEEYSKEAEDAFMNWGNKPLSEFEDRYRKSVTFSREKSCVFYSCQ